MKQGFRGFLCIFLVFITTGCADFRTVTIEEWPTESVALSENLAELYRDVSVTSKVVAAIDGYADIWIRTPKRKEHLYGTVQLERSKDMRIIVSAGVVGWPVADVLFRPDSLFVHDMLNNRVLQGTNHPDNLEKILGLKAGYEFLSDVLAGVVAVDEPVQAIERVYKGVGKVSFAVNVEGGKKELLVNPLTRNIEGLLFIDSRGRKQVEVHFRQFSPFVLDGQRVNLPGEIDVMMFNPRMDGAGKHELVIAYDERVVNPADLDIQFNLPENVKVIDLDRVIQLPWM
jgi:hypothetical protein